MVEYYFASEIKALLASGLVTAEIDANSVNNYLSHGWVRGLLRYTVELMHSLQGIP